MEIKYHEGQILITRDKKHILKVSKLKNLNANACNLCFFESHKYSCAELRKQYLGLSENLYCKYGETKNLLPSQCHYFEKIKEGL